jgi:hypothetical protein
VAVGFFVKPIFYKVGSAAFLNSLFSTIYIKLERSDWGSKYPIIMNDLYNGAIKQTKTREALAELERLRKDLALFSPEAIVWDFENLKASPPWGANISSDITDLSNYFITSDGDNLLDVLKKALNASIEIGEDLTIRSL